MIGADVPDALQPTAADGGPYATRVYLGWSLMVQLGESRSMYLALVSSLRLRRLILSVQLVLISSMHLTPMV